MPPHDSLAPITTATRKGYEFLNYQTEDGSLFPECPDHLLGVLRQFGATRGPPQIVAVTFLTTFAYGAIVAVLPKVSTQRLAILNHGYGGEDCNSFQSYYEKPQECLLG